MVKRTPKVPNNCNHNSPYKASSHSYFLRFAVRLGEWNTATDVDCIKVGKKDVCNQQAVDIEVEGTTVHEGYNMNDFNRKNDIALIRLKRPATFTSK